MFPADIKVFTSSQSIVTVSLINYSGLNMLWAFKEMQLAKKPLSETPGLNFFKLMGSGGGNGFSLKPDFGVYALIAVWKNRNYARNFFRTSKVFRAFKEHSEERITLFMSPIKARGSWNKTNPFLPVTPDNDYEGPIAVLTRATISARHLISFWKSVPAVSEILHKQEGLIYSKGIGEYPIFQQATFSIWENKRALQLFAYHSQNHKNVIEKTNEIGWYTEDLFAEFKIEDTDGSWKGITLSLPENKRNGEAVHDLINQTNSQKVGKL